MFRHRTRSLIALAVVAFGVVALLLAGGFLEWIFWATREGAIQNGLGHIRVMRPGYLDSGAADPLAYLLPESSPELSALEKNPQVKVVASRLAFGGLISHRETTLSFLGEGVDPERERHVSRVLQIPQGKDLSAEDTHGVILGQGLATNLGVRLGDVVVLLATTKSGGINAVECHVRGFFSTEVKAYDDSSIRLPIDLARELLRVSGSNSWVIALDSTDHTTDLLNLFRREFTNDNLQFVPWFDMSDFYKKTVALLSRQMDVVELLISLLIVLSISNVLIMNVLERTGEIGTIMALGARRRKILMLFLAEGLVLGVLGGAVGLAVGTVLAKAISTVGIPMPPPPGRSAGYSAQILVTWRAVAGAFALAVATAALAGVYPSWKASRLAIVDSLRHNR